MLKVAVLHDNEIDFAGGAELSCKAILNFSEQCKVAATYDNLRNFRITKQLILQSDFVVVNSITRCDYEFLLIDFLISAGKPYVKWEHDYNFCIKRTAQCFTDAGVNNCCNSERFSAYRRLFAHAKLSVFASPEHYKIHHHMYGAAVNHHTILPPPVDVANIQSLPKKKNTVCFIGDLSSSSGGLSLVNHALQNPHLAISIFGRNVMGVEFPSNISIKETQSNNEVLTALAESEYFFCKPNYPVPGGRAAAEAFLSGCKTISNGNTGFHSYAFYPDGKDEAYKAIAEAPILFWDKVKEAVNIPDTKHGWKNVLVYKSFGGLGDFLFAVPAIHKIAKLSGKITLCVPFILYGLLKKQFPDYEIFPEDYIKEVDTMAFDKIIDLKNYPSGNKDGGNEHQVWFPSFGRLKQHAVQHYLDAVATIHPSIDNSHGGYPHFKSLNQPKGKYFTVHPGAGFAAKCWPADKYGELIERLLGLFTDMECKLILGPADPKVEDLFGAMPAGVSVVPGDLEAVGDMLAGAAFHIGNDSGITHLAGAFNVPTVTIHGPTGPGTWMTFSEHSELIWGKAGVCNIPCNYEIASNCAHRICLHSVTPQRFLKHVLKLLQKTLRKTEDFRLILNPQARVEQDNDAFVVIMDEKELLVEFSESAEREMFEKLIANSLSSNSLSTSFGKLVEVLMDNELLFKIPVAPDAFLKNHFEKERVDITIVGHVLKRDSIGRHGIVIAEMLEDSFSINGITTRQSSANDVSPALYKKLTHNGTPGKLALFTDVLWHNNLLKPYKRLPADASIKVCYSMFESDAIPQEWVSVINSHFDGVLVPDKWLLDVYKRSGVEKPLKVLPLGCYLNDYLQHPLKQKANEVFTFGLSSGIWMRKNIVGLVEAFKLAFPGQSEKVKLRIHSRYGVPLEVEKIRKAINNDPRIELYIDALSDHDYLEFMTSLDAYVMLSMGEGFSVTPREAMALGLPVILSDNTAHRTICESGLVYPVSTVTEIPGFYEAFNCVHGNFFLPDKEIAAALIRELFENRGRIYDRAQERRAWAAKYDLANLKAQYVDTVGRILNDPSTLFS